MSRIGQRRAVGLLSHIFRFGGVCCDKQRETGASSDSYSGPIRSAVWNVFLDGSMSVVWPVKSEVGCPGLPSYSLQLIHEFSFSETYPVLELVVQLENSLIHVLRDHDTYSAKCKVGGEWTRVVIIFLPYETNDCREYLHR